MKTRILFFAAALSTAAAVATSIIGHADNSPSASTSSASKLPSVVTPTDSSMKEPLTDSSFVEKAVIENMQRAELAKLAMEKSQNKKVKNFAKKVADNSSASMSKLKTLASTYRLDIPEHLGGDQKQMIGELQRLNGSDFDTTYVDVMKKTQDASVGLYDRAAGEPTLNAELRVFANQQLPQLRDNQKRVHALKPTAPVPASSAKPKQNLANES